MKGSMMKGKNIYTHMFLYTGKYICTHTFISNLSDRGERYTMKAMQESRINKIFMIQTNSVLCSKTCSASGSDHNSVKSVSLLGLTREPLSNEIRKEILRLSGQLLYF